MYFNYRLFILKKNLDSLDAVVNLQENIQTKKVSDGEEDFSA